MRHETPVTEGPGTPETRRASLRHHRLILLGCTLALLHPAPIAAEPAGAASANLLGWPIPTRTARPWSRWWWLGSAVDRPNIERLLSEYHDAGLGGVEICPIYGAKGYEDRFIEFLSPQWMDMLAATTRDAARLDMGVDMTTGTGWPMGGPWVPADEASESVSLRQIPVAANGRVPDLAQVLAPDTGPRRAATATARILVCLRAVSPGGLQVDLTDRVHSGVLVWAPPGKGWSLYALTAEQPVHWAGPLHILLDFFCARDLIHRRLIGKFGLEFVLPFCVRRIGQPLFRRARRLQRREDVGRTAGRRDGDEHIARATKPAHLTLKCAIEAVIVSDRGQHRRIGRERDGRQRIAVEIQTGQKFAGYMLGIGGAAAVAGEQELAAAAEAARNRFRNGVDRTAQLHIARRAVERLARPAEMRHDHVIRLAHG